MNIGSLFIKLGIKTDTKDLKNFTSIIDDLPNKIFNLKNALIAGAAFGLTKVLEGSVDTAQDLQNFNTQTGLSIDKLQEWQRAAKMSNLEMSTEEVTANLTNLQDIITGINKGLSGGNAGLQRLEIGVEGKDAFQVLEEIREKGRTIYKDDQSLFKKLVSDVGLSPNMLNALSLSQKEFHKAGQGSFMNAKQREDLLEAGKHLQRLKFQFEDLANSMMSRLIPVFDIMFKGISKLVKELSFLATSALNNKAVFISLASVFAAWAISMSPVTAGLTALIWLISDLTHFFSGEGESQIGNLINWIEGKDSKGKQKSDSLKKSFPLMGDMGDEGGFVGTFSPKKSFPLMGDEGSFVGTLKKWGMWDTSKPPVGDSQPINLTQNINSNGLPKEVAEEVAITTKDVLQSYAQQARNQYSPIGGF